MSDALLNRLEQLLVESVVVHARCERPNSTQRRRADVHALPLYPAPAAATKLLGLIARTLDVSASADTG
jgi:hypothetical protein